MRHARHSTGTPPAAGDGGIHLNSAESPSPSLAGIISFHMLQLREANRQSPTSSSTPSAALLKGAQTRSEQDTGPTRAMLAAITDPLTVALGSKAIAREASQWQGWGGARRRVSSLRATRKSRARLALGAGVAAEDRGWTHGRDADKHKALVKLAEDILE